MATCKLDSNIEKRLQVYSTEYSDIAIKLHPLLTKYHHLPNRHLKHGDSCFGVWLCLTTVLYFLNSPPEFAMQGAFVGVIELLIRHAYEIFPQPEDEDFEVLDDYVNASGEFPAM